MVSGDFSVAHDGCGGNFPSGLPAEFTPQIFIQHYENRIMTGVVTDKTLRAWLRAAPIDRGIGDGLTFIATAAGAASGKASWILRYRFHGKQREEALGRYPDFSLKEARELAREHRKRRLHNCPTSCWTITIQSPRASETAHERNRWMRRCCTLEPTSSMAGAEQCWSSDLFSSHRFSQQSGVCTKPSSPYMDIKAFFHIGETH